MTAPPLWRTYLTTSQSLRLQRPSLGMSWTASNFSSLNYRRNSMELAKIDEEIRKIVRKYAGKNKIVEGNLDFDLHCFVGFIVKTIAKFDEKED
jgi:hypothetical protein